jgi:hypothetical protein
MVRIVQSIRRSTASSTFAIYCFARDTCGGDNKYRRARPNGKTITRKELGVYDNTIRRGGVPVPSFS